MFSAATWDFNTDYPVATSFSKGWGRIGIDVPTDKWVYNIRSYEIRTWIEEQPIHMWKFYVIESILVGQNYIFTDEMEAWFTLRWS